MELQIQLNIIEYLAILALIVINNNIITSYMHSIGRFC